MPLSWKRADLFAHPNLPQRLLPLKWEAVRAEWYDVQMSSKGETLREFARRVRLPLAQLREKNKLWAAIHGLPKMKEGNELSAEDHKKNAQELVAKVIARLKEKQNGKTN